MRLRRAIPLASWVVALAIPATAQADTLAFSGRTGTHRHFTCVPEWGCTPYRIAGTITAHIYGSSGGSYVAKAALGIFYSTAALSPDTVLVYGWEVRFHQDGKWRLICIRGRCLFDSRKQSPWPGNPAGGQYAQARFRIPSPRAVNGFRIRVVPLTERAEGRFIGRRRTHEAGVDYYRCQSCVLPD